MGLNRPSKVGALSPQERRAALRLRGVKVLARVAAKAEARYTVRLEAQALLDESSKAIRARYEAAKLRGRVTIARAEAVITARTQAQAAAQVILVAKAQLSLVHSLKAASKRADAVIAWLDAQQRSAHQAARVQRAAMFYAGGDIVSALRSA